MNNQLNLALRLKYDGKAVSIGAARNVNDLNRIPQAINGQIAANQRLGASQSKVMQQQAALGSQLGVIQNGYEQLTGVLGGLATIGTAAMFVRDTGAAQALDTRLQGLTDSAREYNAVQNYLFATADRLNTSYVTLADSYSKILNLQQSGIVNQSEGIQILEGMANAAAKFGASNVQLEQSLFGMTQGMTAGVLRAEELNQVTEPLPGLMQKLDKAAGVAAGGFRQLVNDGRVTSQMFKRYLIKALSEYAGAAEATEGKINASFAEMGNEYQRLIREYEKPVNFAVTNVANAITAGMRELRENKDLVEGLTTSATALAIVLGGQLAGAAAKSTSAFVAKTIATNKAFQADLQLAAANKRAAVTENQRAIQEQAAAKRQLAMASNTTLRSKAIHQLAAANQKAALTQANLNAATSTYSLVARKASVAGRALTGVMGLLGGPVGAAVTAGLAIAYFATQGDTGAKSATELKSRVDELADGFDTLTKKGRAARLVEVNRAFESTSEKIRDAKSEIRGLQSQIKNGITISNNSLTGLSTMSKISLSKEQIKNANDKIAIQEAEVEKLVKEQNRLLSLQKQLKEDVNKPQPQKPVVQATNALPDNIKQLELSLMGEEARLKASYEKRKAMVEQARENDAGNKAKYNAILQQLSAQYSADVKEIVNKREQAKTRIQNEAEEKRKNDLKAELENRIAQIKGYADREALAAYQNQLAVEDAKQQARIEAKRRSQLGLAANDEVGELKYNADNEIRDLERQQELNAAQGFHSQREADEAAHQERLMQIRSRYTGALQSNVMQFANFEKQTQAEKANAIVGLGAQMFKTMGQQSKTAFKAYKAFAITQALINTYQSATSAFAALAPIPIVGPALGAAAAATAVMMGMQQVRQIKSQQPAGIAHGGMDYVPNESTYILQRGERVLSPKQNVEISAMARHYNAGGQGGVGGGSISFSIKNEIIVQSAVNDEQSAQQTGDNIAKRIEATVVANINENGSIIRAIRAA